jgi:hypothetical protein
MFVEFRSSTDVRSVRSGIYVAPNGAKSFSLFNSTNIPLLSEQRRFLILAPRSLPKAQRRFFCTRIDIVSQASTSSS